MTDIYNSIYLLFVNNIFGGAVTTGSPQEFLAMLGAMACVCLLVALPIAAIVRIVKVLFRA